MKKDKERSISIKKVFFFNSLSLRICTHPIGLDRDRRVVTLSTPTDANYMAKTVTKDYEFSFDKVRL